MENKNPCMYCGKETEMNTRFKRHNLLCPECDSTTISEYNIIRQTVLPYVEEGK